MDGRQGHHPSKRHTGSATTPSVRASWHQLSAAAAASTDLRARPIPRGGTPNTCSAVLALAGLALILLPQTLPTVILGGIMALYGVGNFARTITS